MLWSFFPRPVAYLVAMCLLLALGLTGCLSDDSYLARRGSRVNIPTTTPPGSSSDRSILTQLPTTTESVVKVDTSTTGDTGIQGNGYFVSIGRVALDNHAGDDLLSEPDIYVQVQRRDPVVLDAIRREEERLSVLNARRRALEKEMESLQAKKRQSEVVPGEPLSPTRLRRLAELTRVTEGACDGPLADNACRKCERYDERQVCRQCEACKELRFLLEKKAESEVVPGAALDSMERERLRELEALVKRLAKDMGDTRSTARRLRKKITAKTHTVTTPGFHLDYGFRSILEVFPGDELWVSVYDEDLGEDDLYGSTVFRVPKGPMTQQEVELSMPNVRSVILRLGRENESLSRRRRVRLPRLAYPAPEPRATWQEGDLHLPVEKGAGLDHREGPQADPPCISSNACSLVAPAQPGVAGLVQLLPARGVLTDVQLCGPDRLPLTQGER